jgi:hypothetical protein
MKSELLRREPGSATMTRGETCLSKARALLGVAIAWGKAWARVWNSKLLFVGA